MSQGHLVKFHDKLGGLIEFKMFGRFFFFIRRHFVWTFLKNEFPFSNIAEGIWENEYFHWMLGWGSLL